MSPSSMSRDINNSQEEKEKEQEPMESPKSKTTGKRVKKASKKAAKKKATKSKKATAEGETKKETHDNVTAEEKLLQKTLADTLKTATENITTLTSVLSSVEMDIKELQRVLVLPPRKLSSYMCRSKSISHMPRPKEVMRQIKAGHQQGDDDDVNGEFNATPGVENCDDLLDDDRNQESAISPLTYVMESQSEYRRGGYHPVVVGDCFHQRYYALHKLGWGHYSTVWLCFDTQQDRYCAIKVIKSAELYVESARQEVLLLRHLAKFHYHPLRHRVVSMTDNFAINGVNGTHHCVVFNGLGDNMLMLIQRSGYQGLPLHNVKQIAYQVLQGLMLLHDTAHLIHTDLKPENVLLITDDVAFRTYANEASRKYLDGQCSGWRSAEEEQDQLGSPEQEQQQQQRNQQHQRKKPQRLSKTAKRKLRSRSKQTVSFFQSHRKWLRDRGLADLLLLARNGLLAPPTAANAVTGKLPWLAFDSPQIFSEEEQQELLQLQSKHFTEQVGDRDMTHEPPSLSQIKSRKRAHEKEDNDRAIRLLRTDSEKFINYVMKRIEREEKDKPHYSRRKRSKRTRKRNQPAAACNYPPHLTTDEPKEPNLNLLYRKDPALEPCPLQVAIADVGNSCFVDNHLTEDIQTREYRAVEVILGAGYDTSTDLWSAACLFWELATGEYLFDPNKWHDRASYDEVHIAHIIETCGPIPLEMIERGEYSRDVFNARGKLLHVHNLTSRRLDKVLIDRYGWGTREATEFCDFLMPMLTINPISRISAKDALNDPWLKVDTDTAN